MGLGCCICNEELYQKSKSSVIVGDPSKIERPVASTKCGHLFHNDCLKNWFMVKQGNEVWTTRHCPKCEISLTVATDIFRISQHPASNDGSSEDLDEANGRVKKLQNDKEELIKRLETSFLQSRDAQKLYNKLEKDNQKRKNNEAHLREELSHLRKENEDLRNTVVRMSQNMSRNEAEASGNFVTNVPVAVMQPPPQQHPAQFYNPYPGNYVNPNNNRPPAFAPYVNVSPYPQMGQDPNQGAGMAQNPGSNGFRPYLQQQQPQAQSQSRQDGGGHGHGHAHAQQNMTRPPRHNNSNKTSGKSKYDYYIAEYNGIRNGLGKNNNKGKYREPAKTYGSDNDSSDSDKETRKRRNGKEAGAKESGSKYDIDKSSSEFYQYLRNGASSPNSDKDKKSTSSSGFQGANDRSTSPDEAFFESFFKNSVDDSDMMKFIEEEQAKLANRLALQGLSGQRRIFGKYKCSKCGSKWGSAKTDEGQMQKCAKCKNEVYPYEQGPVLNKSELRALRKRF